MPTLSVIITTKNHEAIIERALQSVQFADEIILVDLHSTDNTVEIASNYTDKIFQHQDFGYVEPVRNFSIDKATGDWILIIDADEEVSSGLKKIIQSIIKAKNQVELADCFYLPRKNIIFNKWIKKTGWWPDYQLRFFRKDQVEWSNQIHSVPITKGEVKELPPQEKFALIHHNYQTITQFIQRLDRYTAIQASERDIKKYVGPDEILQEFTSSFLQRLFAQDGIGDQAHGISLSILQSTADAVTAMKIWEKQKFTQRHQVDDRQILAVLARFQKEFAFWLADAYCKRSSGFKKFYWRIRRKLMV